MKFKVDVNLEYSFRIIWVTKVVDAVILDMVRPKNEKRKRSKMTFIGRFI